MLLYLALLWMSAAAAPVRTWQAPGEAMEGGVLASPGKLITWGRRLLEWDIATGRRRVLAHGPFAGGGCWTGDGIALADSSGVLALRRAPKWAPEAIDTGVQMGDCVWTTLLGHRGLLMVQRGERVRFYEPP